MGPGLRSGRKMIDSLEPVQHVGESRRLGRNLSLRLWRTKLPNPLSREESPVRVADPCL